MMSKPLYEDVEKPLPDKLKAFYESYFRYYSRRDQNLANVTHTPQEPLTFRGKRIYFETCQTCGGCGWLESQGDYYPCGSCNTVGTQPITQYLRRYACQRCPKVFVEPKLTEAQFLQSRYSVSRCPACDGPAVSIPENQRLPSR